MASRRSSSPRRRSTPKVVTPVLRFRLPVKDWNLIEVPGTEGQYRGDCYIPVTALAGIGLENWLDVNPRRPKRRKKSGRLHGTMVPRITASAVEQPERFVLRNRGITLSAYDAEHDGEGLVVEFRDPDIHGVLDGATSAMTLLEVIERVQSGELTADLSEAHVHVTIFIGVPSAHIADIAEALNRSAQVDMTSLNTKRGNYSSLMAALKGHPGAAQIQYQAGGTGEMSVRWVASALELFNTQRYDNGDRQPARLYQRVTTAEEVYAQDLEGDPAPIDALLTMLTEVLRLHDLLRFRLPLVWDRIETKKKYGKLSNGPKAKKNWGVGRETLHFLRPEDHKLPGLLHEGGAHQSKGYVHRGYLWPLLASFRANILWDTLHNTCRWRIPIEVDFVDAVVEECIPHFLSQVASKVWPDAVGENAPVYKACYLACASVLQQQKFRRRSAAVPPVAAE